MCICVYVDGCVHVCQFVYVLFPFPTKLLTACDLYGHTQMCMCWCFGKPSTSGGYVCVCDARSVCVCVFAHACVCCVRPHMCPHVCKCVCVCLVCVDVFKHINV